MKIQVEDSRDGAWRDWFAWHPVRTDASAIIWLASVSRRWDEARNVHVIDAYDAGQPSGGWEYRAAA